MTGDDVTEDFDEVPDDLLAAANDSEDQIPRYLAMWFVGLVVLCCTGAVVGIVVSILKEAFTS